MKEFINVSGLKLSRRSLEMGLSGSRLMAQFRKAEPAIKVNQSGQPSGRKKSISILIRQSSYLLCTQQTYICLYQLVRRTWLPRALVS